MYRRTRVTIIAGACVAALGAMLLIPNGKEIAVADTVAFTSTTSEETLATIDAMLGTSNPLPVAPGAASSLPLAEPAPGDLQAAALTTAIPEPPPIDAGLRPDSIGPSAVNLRAGPSSSTATLAVLQPGQAVHVGPSQDGWIEVALENGTKGWIYSRYLASVVAATPSEPAKTIETRTAKAIVKGRGNGDLEGRTARIEASLAVRSKPSDSSRAMFRTEPGEHVRILDVRGNWLRILTADGSSGWIERAG